MSWRKFDFAANQLDIVLPCFRPALTLFVFGLPPSVGPVAQESKSELFDVLCKKVNRCFTRLLESSYICDAGTDKAHESVGVDIQIDLRAINSQISDSHSIIHGVVSSIHEDRVRYFVVKFFDDLGDRLRNLTYSLFNLLIDSVD